MWQSFWLLTAEETWQGNDARRTRRTLAVLKGVGVYGALGMEGWTVGHKRNCNSLHGSEYKPMNRASRRFWAPLLHLAVIVVLALLSRTHPSPSPRIPLRTWSRDAARHGRWQTPRMAIWELLAGSQQLAVYLPLNALILFSFVLWLWCCWVSYSDWFVWHCTDGARGKRHLKAFSVCEYLLRKTNVNTSNRHGWCKIHCNSCSVGVNKLLRINLLHLHFWSWCELRFSSSPCASNEK